MRKLTPEEKAAKKALAHTHDENCGHAEAPVVEPMSILYPAEETPVEEAPVAEVVAEAPTEEAPVEDKPKKKTAPKY